MAIGTVPLSDACPASDRAPGRPRDVVKRAAMLAAARAVFFARGYDSASIEEIAAAADVSKVTVYAHFRDKPTLLEAVIRGEAAKIEAGLRAGAPDAPLPEVLHRLGLTMLGFLTASDMEAFDRLIASIAARHPGLARRFYDAGPGYVHRQLAAVLEAASARGEIDIVDPLRAAGQLMGLWKGMLMTERRFGVADAPGPDELARRVEDGLAVFVRAYAPAGRTVAAPLG